MGIPVCREQKKRLGVRCCAPATVTPVRNSVDQLADRIRHCVAMKNASSLGLPSTRIVQCAKALGVPIATSRGGQPTSLTVPSSFRAEIAINSSTVSNSFGGLNASRSNATNGKGRARGGVTCTTLGWGPLVPHPTFPDIRVCGESDKGFGPLGEDHCYRNEKIASANHICSAVGTRLCTREDILAGAGRNTGCNFDEEFVWTSTICGGSPGNWSFFAFKAKRSAHVCLADNQTAAARCCASQPANDRFGPGFRSNKPPVFTRNQKKAKRLLDNRGIAWIVLASLTILLMIVMTKRRTTRLRNVYFDERAANSAALYDKVPTGLRISNWNATTAATADAPKVLYLEPEIEPLLDNSQTPDKSIILTYAGPPTEANQHRVTLAAVDGGHLMAARLIVAL